jgi:CheY-like chemotaxis protein
MLALFRRNFHDNEDLAFVTGKLLGLLGFEIQVCNSGKECIRLAESAEFDVVLLDIDMPGMGGFEVCEFIREQEWGAQLGIIAYTGRDSSTIWRHKPGTCFDKHLLKPATEETLLTSIVDVAALRKAKYLQ